MELEVGASGRLTFVTAPSAEWSRPEDLVGETLEGRYRVLRLLGRGGMGAVYEARHLRLDKRVAVKVLYPSLASDERERKRFLREARAATKIRNPHVVEILDFGDHPTTFFVMAFLEGRDLSWLIRNEIKLAWPRAREIMLQILDALAAAHRQGIIHRDMKPANVFVEQRPDGTDNVTVLDFGIAKVSQSSPDTHGITRTNELVGTVTYMSPEQALARPVDGRSDIYSCGIVLYKMLTGRAPFFGSSEYQVLDAHVRQPPPPVRGLAPNTPEEVERIILKALEKNPNDRFSSMDEFAAALRSVDSAGTFETTQPGGQLVVQSPAVSGPSGEQAATVPRTIPVSQSEPTGTVHVWGERGVPGQPASWSATPAIQSGSIGTSSAGRYVRIGLIGGVAVLAAGFGLAAFFASREDVASVRTASVAKPVSSVNGAGAQLDRALDSPAPAEPPPPVVEPVVAPSQTPEAFDEPEAAQDVLPPVEEMEPETPVSESVSGEPSSPTQTKSSATGSKTRSPRKKKVAKDDTVLRRLKAAAERCASPTPVRVKFQIMPSGKPGLITTEPGNRCVERAVSSTTFASRDRPARKDFLLE